MKKIIAIGGGEIGRPGTRIETESIDREMKQLDYLKTERIKNPEASLKL